MWCLVRSCFTDYKQSTVVRFTEQALVRLLADKTTGVEEHTFEAPKDALTE